MNFYSLSIAEISKHFEVETGAGLSPDLARNRLKRFGPNSLERTSKTTAFTILMRQFSNFFVVLLIIAGAVSYFIDGPLQALVLLGIVVINVILGFVQEFKAERSLLALREAFRAKSKVIRGGKLQVVDNMLLVPGDVVVFEAGDKIPADLRLIEEESLRIDEASLTGESVPVSKNCADLPEKTPLADRKNMLYASTVVVAGHGKGIVVGTGSATEFGKIAELIGESEEKTPLERQVEYLGKMMTLIALVLAIGVFVLGYFRGLGSWQLLTFTIALLVAVVPESLPTAITLSLAIGVSRMSAKKAIVRRLAVIETLGTTDIIATDKTGTLTNNELSIDTIALYKEEKWKVVDFTQKNEIDLMVDKLLAHALACSNVDMSNEFTGDPLEVAIAKRVETLDKFALFETKKYSRVMEVPFDSDKKYMAVLVQSDSKLSLIAKGMPEKIIDFCSLRPEEKRLILSEVSSFSKKGYKVIAVADKHLGTVKSTVLSEMVFRGLLCFIDEPASGVKEAIAQAIKAGIRPIIMTGDHPETARFVAERLGLRIADDEIIAERKFDEMSLLELKKALAKVKIFARITPQDKTVIVKTLQKMGYSVAVTGDGVNDAPALKEAQVGIAMGIKGTDVAKESADIILSDDRYGTIVNAIAFGRTIFDNIKNAIVFLLAGNFAEIGLVGLAFLFALPVPLTTLQILWINLITDSFPALALSFEKPSKGVLLEKPRSSKLNAMRGSVRYALILAIISLILSFSLYLWALNGSVGAGRSLVFAYLVALQLIYASSVRSKYRIWQSPKRFFENTYLVGAMVLAIAGTILVFAEPFAGVFGLSRLGFLDYVILGISIAVTLALAEIVRFLIDRRQSKLQLSNTRAS
ncbi:MAG TPA: cation-translocating P-type ATPase [bacterium]|nr:cation-translocating P-type ATPase [bacterium]